MILDRDSVIASNEEILPGIRRMRVEAAADFLEEAMPGRFVQIEVSPSEFPLVRRPFTISLKGDGWFQILYEVRGRGTDILSGLGPGRKVRVLGPLGSGYRMVGGKWLLVGGGLGAAGFPCLAGEVDSCLMLLGASTGGRLLEFPGMDSDCITEDGTSGRCGMVTDLLQDIRWEEYSAVALCGPVAMMKAVVRKVPTRLMELVQVSTEARMGCGWGACEGCSIPAAGGGYLKCCSDGPVIRADLIDWDLWEGV